MPDLTLTSSATVEVDESVPGQVKFNVVSAGGNIIVTDNTGVPITDSDDEEVTL